MASVMVLMSTFNGERFLSEQIDSILNQKGCKISLLVRDDGSTDGTISILEEYSARDSRVSVIKGDNLGYKKSFMSLIHIANESDYYALADQDDVWCLNKLSRALEYLNLEEGKKPKLYYSNSKITDEYLTVLGDLYKKPRYQPNRESVLFNGSGSGFTFVMNKELLELLKKGPIEINESHDRWIQFVARLTGDVIYDHFSSVAFHRIHGNNTSNNIVRNSSVLSVLKSLIKGKPNINLVALDLIETYYNELDNRDIVILNRIANYNRNILDKISLLTNPRIRRHGLGKTLLLKIRLLVNSI